MARLHVHVYAENDAGSERPLDVELTRNYAGTDAGAFVAVELLTMLLAAARDALIAQSRERRLQER